MATVEERPIGHGRKVHKLAGLGLEMQGKIMREAGGENQRSTLHRQNER